MAFDYSELVAVAQELIGDFGRTITFTKLPAAADDPTKPWDGPDLADETSVSVTAVWLEDQDFDGEALVRRSQTDLIMVAAADLPAGTDLRTFDHVDGGDGRRKLTSVSLLKPGPDSIMYMCRAEG